MLRLIYLIKICQLFNLSYQEHRCYQCRKRLPY
nr:MAG TPA: recombination protein [Caudoviricetes sp.]